jgi:nucleoside-diphosphate-sugar epimerase
MTDHRPTILLTGGSGVMGRAFIEEFAGDFTLICLCRRTQVGDPRVSEVFGDLCRRRFGWTAREWRELCRRVDVVLHAGATTNWRADRGRILATNVVGTQEVLSLAAEADARLYHVSTAFAAAAQPTEHPAAAGSGLAVYLESKRLAECVVRDSGLDAVVVRPSVVIGDSRDGRMAAFQGIHKVMGAVYRGLLPVLPAEPSALIDFIAQDVAASAVGRLVRGGVRNGDFWLTAGPYALTVGDMLQLTLAAAVRAGWAPTPPRLVSKESVDRLLLPLLEDVGTPALRRMFHAFTELLDLFQTGRPLPTSLPALGFGAQLHHDRLSAAFQRSIEFWATGATGITRAAAVAAAAAGVTAPATVA